jgi:aryl-alcohol dehydrogenase-like predicted oxidoreductase/ketosteroid isomerase-like protein
MQIPSLTFKLGGKTTVRRLGYGALHLTGPGYWGPPRDPEGAARLLRRAVALGVNFIDTADSYGPDTNEELIRTALKPYPADLVICTKGGLLRRGPTDWSGGPPYIVPCGRPAYLRQQVERSLRNLGTDCIGLYELHRIDPAVPLADQLGELARLREEGKIRHIGISGQPEVTVAELERCRSITEIVAVENLYNVADRAGEAVLQYCEKHGIAFIPWFPLGHGELTAKGGPLEEPAHKRSLTSAQLALAWLLHHSPNLLLIPGTTSIAHLEENMKADRVALDPGELESIARLASSVKPWRPETHESTPGTLEGSSSGEHPNVTTLRTVYADLTRLRDFAAEDVVLHAAERETPGGVKRVVGRDAVDAKERALIAMTGGTLVMEVDHIVANDHFGAVMGVMRGKADGKTIAMPYCGLWRFRDGVILEHWENAYDVTRFFEPLAGPRR